jgi:hypothetical protein
VRFVARVLPAIVVLGVVAGADAKRPTWTWASLHRPLHTAGIAPGTPCPVSRVRMMRLDGRQGTNALLGPGPAYPSLPTRGVLEFVYPPGERQTDFYGSGWSGNKVL